MKKISEKEVLEICSAEMGDCGICPYDGTDTCYLIRVEIKESYEDEGVKEWMI